MHFYRLVLLTLFISPLAWSEEVNDSVEAVLFGKKLTKSTLENTSFEMAPGIPAPKPKTIDDNYRYQALARLISQEVNKRLIQECKIEVTEQEINSYIDFTDTMSANSPSSELVKKKLEEFYQSLTEEELAEYKETEKVAKLSRAKAVWQNHYRFKCLYQRYGGEVIFQQANPQEPVGALRMHLEKLTTEGQLVIKNPAYAEKFWHYFKMKHSFVVPPEKVDFSKPWWQKVSKN